jgi:hypothetical protein
MTLLAWDCIAGGAQRRFGARVSEGVVAANQADGLRRASPRLEYARAAMVR